MSSNRSWDIFCTVVDNYGDIGVCWRLARQLVAERAAQVRLWVDDLASFQKICPDIEPGREAQHSCGVDVRWWRAAFPAVSPADIVIEAFACDPPASYLALMAERQLKPVWINLEYLSAEHWVQGCHALPSPNPSMPLVKHFFFPGFVPGTGGLLAERGLAQARHRFQHSAAEQAQFRQVRALPPLRDGELQVSLFCYPQAAASGLLRAWASGAPPVLCLVPEGVAQEALTAFFNSKELSPGAVLSQGRLEVRIIPFLDQDEYDRLLWACDLNFVRGEDSFVRAQWAARALVWQIYPQRDCAHLPKLEAFLDLYCHGLPEAVAAATRRFWRAWNQDDGMEVEAAWPDFLEYRLELRAHALSWERDLAKTGDLANNLAQFCENLLK
jgi:uncharacterized repeat protein (TIGR03837 family)